MPHNTKLVNVTITFRNIEGTDPLRKYGQEKVKNCIQKFVHQDTEAHVVLRVEKARQIAEVTFRADGNDFKCSEESNDLYTSIDKLVDSLTQQLRKHKEKLTGKH